MLTKLRALGDQLHQEVHKKVDLYESYFIDNYDFKQTLGSGAFGLVMEAEKKITQARVAVKRVKLPTNKEENEKTLEEQDKVHGLNDNSQTISFVDDDEDFDTNVSIGLALTYLYNQTCSSYFENVTS